MVFESIKILLDINMKAYYSIYRLIQLNIIYYHTMKIRNWEGGIERYWNTAEQGYGGKIRDAVWCFITRKDYECYVSHPLSRIPGMKMDLS